jgi:hypothetical protein
MYWKPLEFTEIRTYRSMKRAWIGFRIAYREGNEEKMKYYAEGIQKFERQLGHAVSSFSDILKVVQQESLQKKQVNS